MRKKYKLFIVLLIVAILMVSSYVYANSKSNRLTEIVEVEVIHYEGTEVDTDSGGAWIHTPNWHQVGTANTMLEHVDSRKFLEYEKSIQYYNNGKFGTLNFKKIKDSVKVTDYSDNPKIMEVDGKVRKVKYIETYELVYEGEFYRILIR